MANGGKYDGRGVVELLEDGRRVRLVEPFSYIDPAGLRWDVPAKAVVDGASIPQLFWGIVGGPFEGKYRSASIIHDWYCDIRTRKWQAVHRMFYEAMLTSGVSKVKANLMYAAVYGGGPRWSDTVVENANQAFKIVGNPLPGFNPKEMVLEMEVTDGPEIGSTIFKSDPVSLRGDKKRQVEYVKLASKRKVKPRSYRPKLTEADFEELRASIEGKKMDVKDIEQLVDAKQKTNPRTKKAIKS